MLEGLLLAGVTSVVGIVLVMVFFVTSSDSGSLVIDTITAGGKLDAPVAQRVFWCAFEGIVAITLLLGGGLVALQTASLVTGFPIALMLVAMCYSIWTRDQHPARPACSRRGCAPSGPERRGR